MKRKVDSVYLLGRDFHDSLSGLGHASQRSFVRPDSKPSFKSFESRSKIRSALLLSFSFSVWEPFNSNPFLSRRFPMNERNDTDYASIDFELANRDITL